MSCCPGTVKTFIFTYCSSTLDIRSPFSKSIKTLPVARKDFPRMIEAYSSASQSKLRKSAAKINLSTRTRMSSILPSSCTYDQPANYNMTMSLREWWGGLVSSSVSVLGNLICEVVAAAECSPRFCNCWATDIPVGANSVADSASAGSDILAYLKCWDSGCCSGSAMRSLGASSRPNYKCLTLHSYCNFRHSS
ncbi:hypothetical protein V6N12_009328 [Hibiscus sabdariffa]|uniref:Uncharacterized protein n=1 Tax=Hibiscus sabdariffa TaxID=183260 RepID=A0ABR2E8S5_9ROSI